jgi:predicted nucleic acid-binding protein
MTLVPAFELIEPAIELSLAHNETASDGLFVALALREGLKVVTGDWRMCNAYQATGCLVHISQFNP